MKIYDLLHLLFQFVQQTPPKLQPARSLQGAKCLKIFECQLKIFDDVVQVGTALVTLLQQPDLLTAPSQRLAAVTFLYVATTNQIE